MNLLDRNVIAPCSACARGAAVFVDVVVRSSCSPAADDIGQGTYSALDALSFVMLNMPQQVYELIAHRRADRVAARTWPARAVARSSRNARRGHLGVAHAGSVAMAGVLLTMRPP